MIIHFPILFSGLFTTRYSRIYIPPSTKSVDGHSLKRAGSAEQKESPDVFLRGIIRLLHSVRSLTCRMFSALPNFGTWKIALCALRLVTF